MENDELVPIAIPMPAVTQPDVPPQAAPLRRLPMPAPKKKGPGKRVVLIAFPVLLLLALGAAYVRDIGSLRTNPRALFTRLRERVRSIDFNHDKPTVATQPPSTAPFAAPPPVIAKSAPSPEPSDPDWTPMETPATVQPAPVSAPQPGQPELPARYERFTRELGPFRLEGQNFTVRLLLVCPKEDSGPRECAHDGEEMVEAVQVVDELGRQHFERVFPAPSPSAGDSQPTSYEVTAMRLEGNGHQALDLLYQELPSEPRRGGSYQILALNDGILQPLNRQPAAGDIADLADLPDGAEERSKHLLEGDIFYVLSHNHYVSYLEPVRVNWKNLQLEVPSNPEFEVRYDPTAHLEMGGVIHLFPSPDKTSTPSDLAVTNSSNVEVLRIRVGSVADSSSPDSRDWLKVRVDEAEGWIHGKHDYNALGLRFIE